MKEKTKKQKRLNECVSYRSIFHIPYSIFNHRGFTMLELLIVTAILGVLGAAGAGFYRSFGKNVELQSSAKVLISDLGYMRSKSMIGDSGFKWGAHLVNVTTGNDYYELFSTATNYAAGTVTGTTTLSTGVTFSDPIVGASKDIIFSKITGSSPATTTTLVSEVGSQTITVSSIGAVY